MLDKLKFNNWIISNKKLIEKARVQTFNKFVQKNRRLKAEEPKKRKNVEIIQQLKKLKGREIMVQAMSLDKNPQAVLTNGRSTPEEIVAASLAQSKIIQNLLQSFKEEFSIDLHGGLWKKELGAKSRKQEKIQRTEEKRKRRRDLKDRKVIERKRSEWLQENVPQEELTLTLDTDTMIPKSLPVEIKAASPTENKINQSSLKKAKELGKELKQQRKSKKLQENTVQNADSDTSTTGGGKTLKSEFNERLEEHKESEEMEIQSHLIKVKPKDNKNKKLREEADCFEPKENGLQITEPFTLLSSPTVEFSEDPFFITETGETYLSNVTIVNENETQTSKTDPAVPNKYKSYNKQYTDKPDRIVHQAQRSRHEELSENLHPSWAAKRKMNYSVSNFSGKKQVFPEREGATEFNKTSQRRNNGNTNKRPSDSATENLHPSWAAKQKLKPSITAFQGKKITFGDDATCKESAEDFKKASQKKNNDHTNKRSTDNATENLHPSWAAKQKLKPSITAFQGTKITFKDD